MAQEYRIGEGGLLRRFETAAHLTSISRQIFLVILMTWMPIMLLGLLGEHVTGSKEPLLHDAGVHVRLLVAAPVFLFLDQVFPAFCRRMVVQLSAKGFVPERAAPQLDRTLRSATTMADSSLPELCLLVFSVLLGAGALLGTISVSGIPGRGPLSSAQIWYALTDIPLFQFLLWRSLWRWAIWVRILVGVARLPLDLVPAHPDGRGGISFLRLPSLGYCAMLLFAISSVLCAEWGARFTLAATLAGFVPLLLVFGIVGTLVAFGPLLVFTPRLVRLRRDGLDEVGGLAASTGRQLRARWLTGRPLGPQDGLEVQAFVAISESYKGVSGVAPLLFGLRDLIVLLVATLVPLVPVMLVHIPVEDWLKLGGLVGLPKAL